MFPAGNSQNPPVAIDFVVSTYLYRSVAFRLELLYCLLQRSNLIEGSFEAPYSALQNNALGQNKGIDEDTRHEKRREKVKQNDAS